RLERFAIVAKVVLTPRQVLQCFIASGVFVFLKYAIVSDGGVEIPLLKLLVGQQPQRTDEAVAHEAKPVFQGILYFKHGDHLERVLEPALAKQRIDLPELLIGGTLLFAVLQLDVIMRRVNNAEAESCNNEEHQEGETLDLKVISVYTISTILCLSPLLVSLPTDVLPVRVIAFFADPVKPGVVPAFFDGVREGVVSFI